MARCREAGVAVPPQRIAIYCALLEANDHPNAEAIYTGVRSTMPSLSLATIYKTLDALAGRAAGLGTNAVTALTSIFITTWYARAATALPYLVAAMILCPLLSIPPSTCC